MSMPVRVSTGIAAGIGLVGLLVLAVGVDLGLGQGGMERVAAYPQMIWLIMFGIYVSTNHCGNVGESDVTSVSMVQRRKGATVGTPTNH